PGVVLLDVQLPDTTGFEVARMLLAGPSPPVVVLVSAREAADYGRLIERSGAAGFLSKSDLSARSLGALLGQGPWPGARGVSPRRPARRPPRGGAPAPTAA